MQETLKITARVEYTVWAISPQQSPDKSRQERNMMDAREEERPHFILHKNAPYEMEGEIGLCLDIYFFKFIIVFTDSFREWSWNFI